MRSARRIGFLAVFAIAGLIDGAFVGCGSSSDGGGGDDSTPITHDASIIDSAPITGEASTEAGPPPCAQGLTYVDPEGGTQPNPAPQAFDGNMYGCPGRVLFRDRATLCGSQCNVCSAGEWVSLHGAQGPSYDYWTNDTLGWAGSFFNPGDVCYAGQLDGGPYDGSVQGTMCQSDPYALDGGTLPDGAPLDGGIFDPGPTSMRVCTTTGASDPLQLYQTDALGNTCIWIRCALGTTTVTYPDAGPDAAPPNFDYMGGCADDYTAGTLCCCP